MDHVEFILKKGNYFVLHTFAIDVPYESFTQWIEFWSRALCILRFRVLETIVIL